MTAQYLLRFDDLCPTMGRERWLRFEELLRRFHIKPILAIVPCNLDTALKIDAEDPNFWERMRAWQSLGATIGLHGYTHLCEGHGGGLIPLHSRTEFAGVDEEIQRTWIQRGLREMRAQRLQPTIWVAPRHGFDDATLRVLAGEGIGVLSDGFAPGPFRKAGMVWIPQQLWEPVEKHKGVWTICLHSNSASDALILQVERFLQKHAAEFVSVDSVLKDERVHDRSMADLLFHGQMMTRVWWRRFRKQISRR